MIHEMKLRENYYEYILHGTKRIEIRLYDEKRQKIKIGDRIKFLNEENLDKYFTVRVIGLLRYDTLDNLLRDFDCSILADSSVSCEELKMVLEEFYTKEKQDEYGILGIRIELDN